MMQQDTMLDSDLTFANRRKHVWKQLGGDLAAAAISATLVSPIVAIIDRAIVEKASSNRPLWSSLRTHALSVLKRPGRFFFTRPFGIVWTLYAVTFTVANGAESVAKEFHPTAVGSIVFASTFLVNVPLGVWKDIRFAQFYGTNSASGVVKAAKAVPLAPTVPLRIPSVGVSRAAVATFLVRDGMTIFGSFTLAPWLPTALPDGLFSNPHTEENVLQLVVPSLTQLVATPLHILGLDYHSRQHAVPFPDRLSRVRQGLPSATLVRCIRIIPAFGFGCLANRELRSMFHTPRQGTLQ